MADDGPAVEDQRIVALKSHLAEKISDCKRRRDAFWRLHHDITFWRHVISIPLLLVTTVTGVTSVAQATAESANSQNKGLSYAVAVVGVVSAALAALQKYFNLAERGEKCRTTARNYDKLKTKLDNKLLLIEADSDGKWGSNDEVDFKKFVEKIQKEMDVIWAAVEDVPRELIDRLAGQKCWQQLPFISCCLPVPKSNVHSIGTLPITNRDIGDLVMNQRSLVTLLRRVIGAAQGGSATGQTNGGSGNSDASATANGAVGAGLSTAAPSPPVMPSTSEAPSPATVASTAAAT